VPAARSLDLKHSPTAAQTHKCTHKNTHTAAHATALLSPHLPLLLVLGQSEDVRLSVALCSRLHGEHGLCKDEADRAAHAAHRDEAHALRWHKVGHTGSVERMD